MSTPRSRRSSTPREILKQVSFYIPLSRWKQLRGEAVRRQIPLATLCQLLLDSALPRQ